jgi:hypothetical protein
MQPLGQHHQDFTMLDRLLTSRLRPVLTLLGLSGFLALAACGGGSGAPNNPYAPGTATPVLTVEPAVLTAYSGIPVTVTVTGGAAPFFAFTSNASVLPVAQNVADNTIVLLPNKVTADTDVILTVQDSAGQTKTVAVTVKAAPIFNALTFTPSSGDCGTNLCSGQTGAATVVATGPAGAPLVARQIRFDVIFGPIGIATSNPAMPLAQTLTVATDVTGTATVVIQALANATTQPAQIRATDVTSGQQQIANFTVVNNTVGTGSPIVVIPATATITGALTTSCSSGFRVDYYIYGGNPPYTVSSTFPTAVILSGSPVPSSGRFFSATTNGTCVNPLTFTIVDSAGKQTTAQLINQPGTTAPPPPGALKITPAAVSNAACTGKTFTFVITGGSPNYNVTVNAPGVATPQIVTTSGGTTDISGLLTGSGSNTVIVVDSGSPQQTTTATITCP